MLHLNKVPSFLLLSRKRKLLFFKVILLSIQRGFLRIICSSRAFSENLLGNSSVPTSSLISLTQLQEANDISVAVELGRKYIPWKNLCRHQAWQAIILLRKAGIPFTYHVGIKKDKDSPNRIDGHAWVMVNGRFVSGKCDLSKYREIKFSLKDHKIV